MSKLKQELESCSTAQQSLRKDGFESDPLDSFMADVANKIDSDKVTNIYTLVGRFQVKAGAFFAKINLFQHNGDALMPEVCSDTQEFIVCEEKGLKKMQRHVVVNLLLANPQVLVQDSLALKVAVSKYRLLHWRVR